MLDYNVVFGSMKGIITFIATIVLVKYYLYLAIAPFYPVQKLLRQISIKRKIKKGVLPKKYKPLVSIVIPAWNEAVGIVTTVKSALNNTYDNIEIIVVNDGSTDNTDAVMKAFLKEYKQNPLNGKKIVYIRQANGGKGVALNTGITRAQGEIVVTMDADSAHEKHAVANMVEYFRDPSIDALVGNVKVANNHSLVGSIQKLEYIFGFYFKRVHSIFNAEYIFGGACAAFRKGTTFDAIGLFDTKNKTEDIEYSMRTKLHGLKSLYAEDVLTYTEGASEWKGLYKQRLRWKKGRIDTFIKYRNLFLSTNKAHSKFLSWIVLPYAAFGDFQMIFEPMFFTLIWAYTIISGDYLSVGLSSLFIFFTFAAAILFGDRKTNRLYILYFPVYWMLFYVLVGVEFLALIKSVELSLANQDVVWQSWARKGIKSSARNTVQEGALA
jgi:poly-beta-1,6-N-acetyl-D-glucosamine synthase